MEAKKTVKEYFDTLTEDQLIMLYKIIDEVYDLEEKQHMQELDIETQIQCKTCGQEWAEV